MSGQPWYRHHARDFLDGIVGLNPELIGAYIVVLDLIYSRGASCPTDYRWLSGHMGCTPKMAEKLVAGLIGKGKLSLTDGQLSNRRADDELSKTAEISEKFQNSGKIGGKKRAENERQSRENKDLVQASLKHKRGEENREEDDDDARARAPAKSLPDSLADAEPVDLSDMQTLAQECARAAGTRQADPVQFGRDINLCRDWILAGADAELILDEIRGGVVACTEPRGVSSLRYFDQRIRTAAAKRKALENGIATRQQHQPPARETLASRTAARIAARRAAADSEGDLGVPGRALIGVRHD